MFNKLMVQLRGPSARTPLMIAISVLIIVSVALATGSRSSAVEMITVTDFLMDTYVTIRIPSTHENTAGESLAEMERLNVIFDRFDSRSEVARINAGAGSWVEVGPEMLDLLSQVAEMDESIRDLFDITVGPLMDVWGFGQDDQKVPDQKDLDRALSLVDGTQFVVDFDGGRVMLAQAGMTLDLGGVAKGYIVDRAVSVLRDGGVKEGLIEVGGDVYVIGQRPGGDAWRIGVQNPRQGGAILGVLHLKDQAVATSGDYQRYFIDNNGERYHHILDPRTGYPPDTVISVTVVGATVTQTDILSTAIFLMGPQEGLAYIESLDGVEGIIIDSSETMFVSQGLRDGERRPFFEER